MATLNERVAEAHQAAQVATEAASSSWQANWPATVAQLKRLVEAELDVTDVPDPVHIHKDYSHGSPEADYAVVQVDDTWLGLPVSDNPAADTCLLGILHCDNEHILGFVTPVGADDSWEQTLVRMENHYGTRPKEVICDLCVSEGKVALGPLRLGANPLDEPR